MVDIAELTLLMTSDQRAEWNKHRHDMWTAADRLRDLTQHFDMPPGLFEIADRAKRDVEAVPILGDGEAGWRPREAE